MKLLVKDLHLSFDDNKKILNGISFQTEGDKILAIVGASGCGKSTLLRALCGIFTNKNVKAMSGVIEIDGLSSEEYTKKGNVGFMFQDTTLLPNLTVRENIKFPAILKKMRLDNEIDKLIKTVGLFEFSNFLPAQLSGGMKTRVALARTFVTAPKLLLLDEPFGSLDIKWRFKLYQELEILRQLNRSTIILVTHDIQEALLLSNHILVFGSNGTVIKELLIDKPLPRVFETNSIKILQDEYLIIQDLIMDN